MERKVFRGFIPQRKKLEKNDITFGDNVYGGGNHNKSQECF